MLVQHLATLTNCEMSTPNDGNLGISPLNQGVELSLLVSHATIFQSYDSTDVQADLRRNCTYGWAPNAIDVSQGSLTCPPYTDTGPPFLYGDSDTSSHLVAFYDTLGIRRIYSRPKPPASSRIRKSDVIAFIINTGMKVAVNNFYISICWIDASIRNMFLNLRVIDGEYIVKISKYTITYFLEGLS